MQTTGLKYDDFKLPYNLLDRTALDAVAEVLAYGAVKYSAENWRGGIHFSRLIAASLRHTMSISSGEDLDPETGLPHAAHAICSLMFLLWMMKNRPDLDDRWRPEHVQPTPSQVIDQMEADIRDMAAKLAPELRPDAPADH